ncbi:MAG: LCP family protein [Bacilli bacterium]|nr:LCP family protein [Bacilli bacterium]
MREKKKKKVSFIYKIISFLLLIVTLFFLGNLIFLNVLSNTYLVIIIGIVLILNGFLSMMMLKGKKKKIGSFLSIIVILIFSLLDFYLAKTTGLMSNLNLNYKTYNYSVIVLKSSHYKKLKDITGKELGYYDDSSDITKEALNKVMTKEELTAKDYNDTEKLANALMDKKVDAVLIEDSYLDILNENIIIEGKSFKDYIRKIYKFVLVKKTSDIAKDTNVTKTPFNVYVSGIDTYGEISSVSRSDVNMVITVNPETQQILLTSIPRDYYVKLHGKSGYRDKLTHAGLYGVDMSIQTIEDLLDIDINYYVKVNFSSVVDIVNAIGGVNVYSDYTFTSIDNYHYTKGYNAVNGEEALSFARERKAFAAGDRQRVKDQQALLKAIFDKCTSKAIITKYSKLLDSMKNSFVTNMKMSRLTSLVKMQLSKNYEWNIVTNSLNGSDSKNYTYSAPSSLAYVMEPTEESVSYAHELIQRVLDGEKLDKETVDADASQANKVTHGSSSATNSNSSSSSSSSSKTDSSNHQEGLKLKLGKTEVTYNKNTSSSFVYYGYTLTYNGSNVPTDRAKETFTINGRSYHDYKDLVSYVSSLDNGTYSITYEIVYQGYVAKEIQKVIITGQSINDSSSTKPSIDKPNDKEDTNESSSSTSSSEENEDEYPTEGEE